MFLRDVIDNFYECLVLDVIEVIWQEIDMVDYLIDVMCVVFNWLFIWYY